MASQAGPNKAKTGANAVFFVALILGVLVFINLIGTRVFHRFDLTEDKVYTLSPASKELVKTLPDRMTVKAFMSKDLQPPFSQVAQYTRDLLDEYASASGGKLKWELLDPGDDKKMEEEAEKLKVKKVGLGTGSSEKRQVALSYLGVAFEYQGKVESLPLIQSEEGLEFQMSTIIKMLAVKKKKIVFAASEGEMPIEQSGQHGSANSLATLHSYLSNYQVETQPLTGKLLADDVDLLVIAGPRTAMSERGKFVIDQFLMKGKAVFFMVTGMVVEAPGGMQMPNSPQPMLGRKNDHGLDDLLEHYGFRVHDDIIMEPELNVPGVVMVRGRATLANYPSFAVSMRLSSTNPITESLKGVIFPMASSLELVPSKQPGLEVSLLASSSSDAWRQSGIFVMDAENLPKPGADKGPFSYAYSATGKLTSFFAGKDHPDEKGQKVPAPVPNTSNPPGAEPVLDASIGSPRLVLVGDSGFASDEYLRIAQYVRSYETGLVFGMSAIDWLTQDETLTALRRKSMQSRPLHYESESAPRIARYGNVIGISLLFILFGVVRSRLRKRRREAFTI